MKKRILTGLTLILTVLFSFSLLAAENAAEPAKRKGKKAAMIAKLLPPELSRSRNLVPEDAIAVGFINAEAIIHGKLFPEIMKAAGVDWDALLAAAGAKKEDADACALFYIRLPQLAAPNADIAQVIADPAVELGGSVVYKRAEAIREQFEKSAEDVQKEIVGADPDIKDEVKVAKIKVGERDAFQISIPSCKLTAVCIAAGRNVVQFRCFFNTPPVLELIPARGEVTPLAASVNLKSAFAIAADGVRLRALAGETQENPELKAIRRVSLSVTEKEKGLSIVLKIASDLDGVQLIQPQIKTTIDGLKEDPMMGPIASRTKVSVEDSTNVVVRMFIPSPMVLQFVQLGQQMKAASDAQSSEPAAAPAPAAEPAPAK